MVPGSDAEAYASKRFPHKTTRRVGSGLRPGSIRSFLGNLPARLPATPVGGALGHVPLLVHGRRGIDGHRDDPGQDDPRGTGACRRPRPAHPRRQPGLARVRAQRAKPALGFAHAEDPFEGLAPPPPGVRQVLSVVKGGACRCRGGTAVRLPSLSREMRKVARRGIVILVFTPSVGTSRFASIRTARHELRPVLPLFRSGCCTAGRIPASVLRLKIGHQPAARRTEPHGSPFRAPAGPRILGPAEASSSIRPRAGAPIGVGRRPRHLDTHPVALPIAGRDAIIVVEREIAIAARVEAEVSWGPRRARRCTA